MNKDDPVILEDWRGRGITPIPYDAASDHRLLASTLARWADLSAINGRSSLIASEVRRIVKLPRAAAAEADRDLVDHLFRRGNANERVRFASTASRARADLSWLDAIAGILAEDERR
jgi:hypothetical protein